MTMLTGRGYPVVFGLIIVLASVLVWTEVVPTEGLVAVLTFEGEKVDQTAEGRGALLSNGKEFSVVFLGGRHGGSDGGGQG